MATVVLRPRRAKPFFFRHPWVFSGAVERVEGSVDKGEIVVVRDHRGLFVARGLYNPDSQIVVRLLSWDEAERVDEDFWRGRLQRAAELRRETLDLPSRTSACRLCYAESDGLPGLVVDEYGEWLVCHFHSAGLVTRRDLLADLMMEVFSPTGILDVSDPKLQTKEGLAPTAGLIRGEPPPERLVLNEGALRFAVELGKGQKTGWFLDQRENRAAAARYARGRRVLDVFSYTGGFGLAALLAGAASGLCVDRSTEAARLTRVNAELNGLESATFATGDACREMERLHAAGERFGLVILDPPKFAPNRGSLAKALEGYERVNSLGLRLLEPDGILVTCSCSQRVGESDLIQVLNRAATKHGREAQILERRGQPPDHPVIASCPETAYLTCLICRVS